MPDSFVIFKIKMKLQLLLITLKLMSRNLIKGRLDNDG